MKDLRDAYFYGLLEKAKQDKNIILLTADMGAFALNEFKIQLPNQFINVGISEQAMISIAAGLALESKKVYCYSISSFLILRAFEQIKIDICNMNLDIILIGIGAGVDYSYDGSTHHCVQDIALLRTLPNMKILCPFDPETIDESLKVNGPAYIRLQKGSYANIQKSSSVNKSWYFLQIGNTNNCVLTHGTISHTLMDIIDRKDITVISFLYLKPFYKGELLEILNTYKHTIVVENHSEIGGLSSIISELKAQKESLSIYALKDEFCDIGGSVDYIYKNYGLDFEKIKSEINSWT